MVNFRQVRITNEDLTEEISLNDFDGYLMTAPTGFGIYMNSEYINIGNQRISVDKKNSFQKITMTVQILGDRNEWELKYEKLRDFISKYIKKGFRLYYTAYENERYIKCDINIVDKTEKATSNLPIKLEIQPLSLWQVDKYAVTTAVSESGNLFIFEEREVEGETWYAASFDLVEDLYDDFNKPYYSVAFSLGALAQAEIENNGVDEMPLKIQIHGEAVNPTVRLIKFETNIMEQYISFSNLTIPENYYLELNSDPTDTYIELVNSLTEERVDVENKADLDSNIYINVPQGRWIIEVTDEQSHKCYTKILVGERYYGG